MIRLCSTFLNNLMEICISKIFPYAKIIYIINSGTKLSVKLLITSFLVKKFLSIFNIKTVFINVSFQQMFLSLLYHLFLYWTKFTVRNCFNYVKYFINFFLLVTEHTLQIPMVRFHIAKIMLLKQ